MDSFEETEVTLPAYLFDDRFLPCNWLGVVPTITFSDSESKSRSGASKDEYSHIWELADNLEYVPKLRLNSEHDQKGNNWAVFSFMMESCLGVIMAKDIYLDDIINNSETGQEPVYCGQNQDSWLTSFDNWYSLNQLVHSAILTKLPEELHEAADQHLKASDLWSYLATYFSRESLVSKAGSVEAGRPEVTQGSPTPLTAEPTMLATSQRVPFKGFANSGREFCEFADPADIFSFHHEDLFGSDEDFIDLTQGGNADASITEVHSQDNHPSTPSSAAITGSTSKRQLSEVHHMSFECVNWGLWMTSADIWQLEGLHNFMVLTELWPGGYFRLNLGPHPSDPNFDSILLEQLKQHADSQQSTHPKLEGVHSYKESAVTDAPVTLGATKVHHNSSLGVATLATATKVAATLAAIPPKGDGGPSATAGVFHGTTESTLKPSPASEVPVATATAAAAATKAVPPAVAGLEAMFKGTSLTMGADTFGFPPRVYEQPFQPVLKHLKQPRGIQGVLSKSASMDGKPLPVGSCGKTYRWSMRLKKKDVSSWGFMCTGSMTSAKASQQLVPNHYCGRTYRWSRSVD